MRDIQATIIIELQNKKEGDLWKGLHKTRRKNIKRAKSSGLVFKEASDEEWQEYYRIYSRIWKEGGVNPEPLERLKEHQNYKLFVTKKDDKVLGGGLIEIQKKGINFVAFASLPEYQIMRVNDFLYWNSILWALHQNMEYVDLGGYQLKARGHMQGINKFKEKWGGNLIIREVEGTLLYTLGRKVIRNLPAARWIWDRIKRRPISVKDKRLKENQKK
jgi:lipid II:glycine glycyltransferase (peptidoglycan interpeptide bridge formation enzyme)